MQHPRLRRADSFFGIHYDFHCRTADRDIGRRVSPAMVRRIIDQLKPDYIQIDCKGHPGVCSYPTRLGNAATSFARDPLKIWRKVTAQRGVALYMHYSGVWDSLAVQQHPAWAARGADGKRGDRATSVFSPYVDQLMIPQLRELHERYGVDGVWVDGDCWALWHDYSPRTLKEWRQATGKRSAPRSSDDPDWLLFCEFCREGFRQYLQHYVDTLHRDCPGLQIASNWAYSSHMPEFPAIDVDFLSGDFWPHDSINSARFEGRILASQGRPWDLMSWGFATRSTDSFRHRTPKTSLQLMQEAALVLALGGGYQCYFNQHRDGSISQHDLDLYTPVAEFCRQRQRWCHRSTPVPQIALLYSTSGLYAVAPNLFSPWGGASDAYRGVNSALVESSLPVDAVHDGHLPRLIDNYPLLVVPEWARMSPAVRKHILRYARQGGAVLILGVAAARPFASALGVRLGPDTDEGKRYWSHDAKAGRGPLAGLWGTFARSVTARPGSGAKLLGKLYTEHDHGGDGTPAASLRPCGMGVLAALYAPLGQRYLTGRCAHLRHHLADMVHRLFPKPLVELRTPAMVDLTVRRIGDQLTIHLCNTAGPHTQDFTWDVLPPTGDLRLFVRLKHNPRAIRLQPAGRKLRWTREGDGVTIDIPCLAIHGVVVIES